MQHSESVLSGEYQLCIKFSNTIKCNLSLVDPGSWLVTEVASFSPGQVGGDCVILQTAQGDTGVYFLSGAWFRYHRVQWEERRDNRNAVTKTFHLNFGTTFK